ncbi:unnamed protein product [Ixodes pacificus]
MPVVVVTFWLVCTLAKACQKKSCGDVTSLTMSSSCFVVSQIASKSSHLCWRACFSSSRTSPYWADWIFS